MKKSRYALPILFLMIAFNSIGFLVRSACAYELKEGQLTKVDGETSSPRASFDKHWHGSDLWSFTLTTATFPFLELLRSLRTLIEKMGDLEDAFKSKTESKVKTKLKKKKKQKLRKLHKILKKSRVSSTSCSRSGLTWASVS